MLGCPWQIGRQAPKLHGSGWESNPPGPPMRRPSDGFEDSWRAAERGTTIYGVSRFLLPLGIVLDTTGAILQHHDSIWKPASRENLVEW